MWNRLVNILKCLAWLAQHVFVNFFQVYVYGYSSLILLLFSISLHLCIKSYLSIIVLMDFFWFAFLLLLFSVVVIVVLRQTCYVAHGGRG
jgi:hypothetical protein